MELGCLDDERTRWPEQVAERRRHRPRAAAGRRWWRHPPSSRPSRAHLLDGGQGAENLGTMDLVVFPEYAAWRPRWHAPELMVSLDGPEVASFKPRASNTASGAASPSWRPTPAATPTTPASSLMTRARSSSTTASCTLGAGRTWEPGNMGIPSARPQWQQDRADHLPRRHVPEMARGPAYKGAEIILRTAGYTAPIRHAWKITNQANAFQNLAYTASVCLCGSDGSFDSMGEACSATSTAPSSPKGGGRPDEIITAELRPRPRARSGRWGVENNPLPALAPRLRGREGRRAGLPYTFMQDMVAGRYQLPWAVQVTDGTPCGFAPPERSAIAALKGTWGRSRTSPPCPRLPPSPPGPSTALHAGQHRPRDHRHADRLLRRRRLCGQDGLRPPLTARRLSP